MTSTRSASILAARAQTILFASALFLCSMPMLAQTPPERRSDKDVKTLIDQVDEGRDKFEGNLDGQFKGSTLRGPTGETKVAGVLQDGGERRARPASVADAPVEKRKSVIARAFDRKDDFLPRSCLDVREGQRQRFFDQAVDFEFPRVCVDDGAIEVRD